MTQITTSPKRVIIDDFAKEIAEKKQSTGKPSTAVINFRTDRQDGIERIVYKVPISILRFRKDNGRIASDVLDYEQNVGILNEVEISPQIKIEEFLREKDPEKTSILRSSIVHEGQQEPAIITCDGFLINGNRRKMVLESLSKESPGDEKFEFMKVVILPGSGEEGGPPTLVEIEQIENRYQLQKDGKSEYYGFDRALSIKRKVETGLSLGQQILDDPYYAGVSKAELKKAVKKYTEDFLKPLECVERYLRQFNREKQYRTISKGMSDPEGRWQSFIDYSKIYERNFKSSNWLLSDDNAVEEDDIGQIEEAAFNIIRLRVLGDGHPKVHSVMRQFHKLCKTSEGKQNIMNIASEVETILPQNEIIGCDGNTITYKEIEAKWAAKNKNPIIYNYIKARDSQETKEKQETPLSLLEAALKKLNHESMDLSVTLVSDLQNLREIVTAISARAQELEKEIYRYQKNHKNLKNHTKNKR